MGESSRSRRRRRPSRSRRSLRAESHSAAVADAHEDAEADIPVDPLIPADATELIDDADALAGLIDEVREEGIYAFDTEFIGEESYVPQLCLLQVSTPTRLVLVDPMDGLDVTGLWELIADPDVRTLVHAGQPS